MFDFLDIVYWLESWIFVGLKEFKLFKEYGLGDMVFYGWFVFFFKLLVGLLYIFYSVIGNYGIVIIFLIVMVRSVMMLISCKVVWNV